MTGYAERRPLLSLLLLVLINLLLLSIQVRSPQGRLLIRSWGIFLFSPVAYSASYLGGGLGSLLDRYLFLLDTEAENRELRQQNIRLKMDLEQLQGLREMVERSQKFSALREQYLFETVLANVIWRTDLYAHRMLISAGSSDGIAKDGAVLSPSAIVGRIFATTPFSAEVELITNSGAAAGAMFSESRLQGIIEGNGSGQLSLSFVPNSEDVEVGEIVYTSGNDRVYPKGIPIGTVTYSERGSTYRDILVEPIADFQRIEEVIVVLSP